MRSANRSGSIGFSSVRRRDVLAALAAIAAAPAASALRSQAATAAQQPIVFTWAGWDIPEFHGEYLDKHGAPPEFTYFSDIEAAFQKLLGGYRADIAEPNVNDTQRWKDAGLLDPIDPNRLAHWSDVYEVVRTVESAYIDGALYFVPTMYASTSILYRTDLVDVQEESWSMLWDERYKGQIAPLDAAYDVVVSTAIGLGMPNPFNLSDDELAEVKTVLRKQRDLARYYWGNPTDLEQSMANGEVLIAYGWAETFPRLLDQGVPIAYARPKEGRLAQFPGLVVLNQHPADPQLIYDYVDARISPETSKNVIELFGMIGVNEKGMELADPQRIADLGIGDLAEEMESTVLFQTVPPMILRKYVRMFEEVKAGE